MAYSNKQPSFDRDHAEQHRAEIDRAVPVTEGDPAFLYLTEVRGIPAKTVLGCADLRMLPAPIPGRDRVDFACVSLLRTTPDAEPTGAELAFVDVLGHPAALEPRRVQWSLAEHGCRNAWFWAGGAGDIAVVAEGFGPKPLALLAAGVSGLILGWGARPWLRQKKLPAGITKLVIVADRRPAEGELSRGRQAARGAARPRLPARL